MEVERVVVVGGGVLGMMHALEARRRGHEVIHLEREPVPRGASVRNFGLIWVSGRAPGAELELALRARARWAQIAGEVPGTGFRAVPSLTLAAGRGRAGPARRRPRRCPTPAAEGLRAARAGRMPGGQRARSAGSSPAGSLGSRDAIVEPRLVLRVLRAHLASRPGRLHLAARPGGGRAGAPRRPRPHGGLAPRRPGHPVPRRGAQRDRRPAPGRLGPRAGAPGAAADDADGAVRRAADDLAGRRRLAALLPGLRPAGPRPPAAAGPGRGRGPRPSCCWCSALTAASPSATRTSTTSRSPSTWTRTPTITCAAGPRRCSAPRCRAPSRRWAGVYSHGHRTDSLYHARRRRPA